MQLKFFEILMHLIIINIFVFHNYRDITIIIKTLINANATKMFDLIEKKNVYIK
jgi:hypothetical protein